MFADDTNFFHSDKNIKNIFQIFNQELFNPGLMSINYIHNNMIVSYF